MPPDMVLFDCDGVLVDSEPLTAEVLRKSLAGHGLPLSRHDLDEMFLGGTIMGLADTARQMGAQLPASWIDDIYEEIFAVLGARVEVIDGIWQVLDALDGAGVAYAVGSNGPHRKMQVTLGRTGLIDRFHGRVYSREDVASPKPAPDVYLRAASDAGIAPVRCVVIEDSPNGARAGVAAGMQVFGFAAETPAARLDPVCDRVFARMRDLPALLGL
ncbi:MAG: HAD family phosphatase [Pseudomonadota bacterium]